VTKKGTKEVYPPSAAVGQATAPALIEPEPGPHRWRRDPGLHACPPHKACATA